jgi:hypothetical protein
MYGAPLFVPTSSTLVERRDGAFLLASSYGAVYGMLRHNGRKLYTADATDGRDSAFDLSDDRTGRRVTITQATSVLNRRLIADELNTIAASNHFQP